MGITNHKSTLADSSERMDGDIEELFRDTLAAGADALAPVDLLGAAVRARPLVRQFRPDEQALPGRNAHQSHRQDSSHGDQPLLPAGQAGASPSGAVSFSPAACHAATPLPAVSSR